MTSTEIAKEPRIVVGVDGSESSLNALRWAAQLAPALDCGIEAVMAWFDPRQSAWSPGWGYLSVNMDPEGEIEKALATAVDEAFGASRPARLEGVIVKGPRPMC